MTSDYPVQDPGADEPTMRLRDLLAIVRILAGRRGRLGVSWYGQGYTYVVIVRRGRSRRLLSRYRRVDDRVE